MDKDDQTWFNSQTYNYPMLLSPQKLELGIEIGALESTNITDLDFGTPGFVLPGSEAGSLRNKKKIYINIYIGLQD